MFGDPQTVLCNLMFLLAHENKITFHQFEKGVINDTSQTDQ